MARDIADAQLAELNEDSSAEPIEEYELEENAEIDIAEEPSFEEEIIQETPNNLAEEMAETEDFDNTVVNEEPIVEEELIAAEEPVVEEAIEEVAEELIEEMAEEEAAEPVAEEVIEPVSSPVSYADADLYIVQPGDTLGKIAYKLLGASQKWKELANSNNLSNPNVLHPGDVIKFDKAAVSEKYIATRDSNESTFTVKKGDSLASIAKEILGTEKAWRYLWAFNRDTILNPNKIQVGQVIAFVKPDYRYVPSVNEAVATGQGEPEPENGENTF